jgi:hypothetical protein
MIGFRSNCIRKSFDMKRTFIICEGDIFHVIPFSQKAKQLIALVNDLQVRSQKLSDASPRVSSGA